MGERSEMREERGGRERKDKREGRGGRDMREGRGYMREERGIGPTFWNIGMWSSCQKRQIQSF